MLGALTIAIIVVLVAIATWLVLIPYGRCLAGEWSQGAAGPTLRLASSGWFSDDVMLTAPLTVGGTTVPAGVPLYHLQIHPGTHSVKFMVKTAAGDYSELAAGTVSYSKNKIAWDKPLLGAITWEKLSQGKHK
jgi:hypothetical protein